MSISVITYNHEKFIRQCLDGILAQKTNFDFEVLLGEDNSTDKTRDICIEYAERYPEKIRLFLHDRANVINIGGKPSGRYNFLFNFSEARGKYLAICEGDDYWTDPTKLRKQVDFMESHPEYSICFHPVKVVVENSQQPETIFPEQISGFTLQKLLEGNYIQTNSVLYRKQSGYNFVLDVMPGDWYFHLYHAQFGKVGFINEVMAVYRRHPGGIWWGSHGDINTFWAKNGVNHLAFYNELLGMYGEAPEYRKIVVKNIVDGVFGILKLSDKDQEKMLTELATRVPSLMPIILTEIPKAFEKIIEDQNLEIDALKDLIKQKDQTLKRIKSSRVWKARNKAAKVVGKETL